MKTFILIHGSWHSSWNWHRVVNLIEKAGHRAIPIDLPGMGRDKTPINDVRFHSTVEKICQLIDGLEGQVVLVGHSKNGVIISQVAEYRPDRVEKLIYLAAYLIPHGKTQREYSLQDTNGVLRPFVTMADDVLSHTLQPEIYKEGLYHDCDEHIVELAKLVLSAEPVESAITPLELSEDNFGRVPRIYIECLQDRAVTPFIQKKMYSEMPCEKVYSMNTSHSPFFSDPQGLVEILLDSTKNKI